MLTMRESRQTFVGPVRRWLVAGLLLLAGAVHPALATTDEDAQAMTARVLDEVVGELRGNDSLRNDKTALHAFVEKQIVPYFDFRRMSQRVLAKHWRKASEAQRDAFTTEFKALLIRTYSTAMVQYSDNDVRLLGTRERKPGKQVSVRAQVLRSGDSPVPVNFEMFNGKNTDGWKVFDVSVDGVSIVINFRAGFDREVRAKGLDALIQSLRDRGPGKGG